MCSPPLALPPSNFHPFPLIMFLPSHSFIYLPSSMFFLCLFCPLSSFLSVHHSFPFFPSSSFLSLFIPRRSFYPIPSSQFLSLTSILSLLSVPSTSLIQFSSFLSMILPPRSVSSFLLSVLPLPVPSILYLPLC